MVCPLSFVKGKKTLDIKKGGQIYGSGKFSPKTILQNKEYLDFVLEKHPDIAYIGIDTNFIAQIDFDIYDDIEYSQDILDLVSYFKENTPYYPSVSKSRGIHAFVSLPHQYFEADRWVSKSKVQGKAVADLLTGQWAWAKRDIIIHNTELPILELTADKIDCLFEKTAKSKSKSKTMTEPKPIVEVPEDNLNSHQKMLLDCGKLLTQEYLDRYDNWIRWVSALANDTEGNNFTIANILSSYSKYYDIDELKRLWGNVSNNNTLGTFFYFCKSCDEEAYGKIRSKYHLNSIRATEEDFTTDEAVAEEFLKSNAEDIIYKDDVIYHYNKTRGTWSKDNLKTLGILQSKVRREVGKWCKDMLQETAEALADDLSATEQERLEEIEKDLRGLRTKIRNTFKSDSVCKMIKQILSCAKSKVEFDMKPYLFSFDNITFNLNTGKSIIPERKDYVCLTTGTDYREPTEEEMLELYKLESSIFPVQAHKDFYRKVMATCLYGQNPEIFVLANGSGGNGKGVWHELMSVALGKYYYNAPCSILLSGHKSGPSPEIANMRGARVILMSEPEQNKRINNSLMKELSGGKAINARLCHSNDTEVRLTGTMIMECNVRPKLGDNTGGGEERRLIDFPFLSSFTNKKEILDKNYPYTYKANPYYKSVEFQQKYQYAWFKLYFNYLQSLDESVFTDLEPPKDIKERTQEHIDSSNDFLQELHELIKLEDMIDENKDKVIKLKDLFEKLKMTHFYQSLSKHEQRHYNQRHLKEHITTKLPFKAHFKDRHAGLRCVLTYATFKTVGEESETEDPFGL
jgi:phage/plasmid-associated DNA primase